MRIYASSNLSRIFTQRGRGYREYDNISVGKSLIGRIGDRDPLWKTYTGNEAAILSIFNKQMSLITRSR
ncbi:uncharacterized protein METZ01_LOCUS68328 [marine metagenome]|uniref:Uncharacterized protein n=1 Tax=marine metagenome TaxID=408172 RepID=A0A381TI85_9ZZZZ